MDVRDARFPDEEEIEWITAADGGTALDLNQGFSANPSLPTPTGRAGLVVPISWVISGSHPNFVATMIRLAGERQLKVVDDQHGCPTVCTDLAHTSLEALESSLSGVLHVTNQGPTTWYQLAKSGVAEVGLDPGAVSPCSTSEYPTEAARPAYSVSGSERLEESGVSQPPHWRESLPGVVAEIKTWI